MDETAAYWSQFNGKENSDFFSSCLKKKSRLEVEKENAIKARIKEQEDMVKNRDSLQAKKQVVLAFDTHM